MITKVTPKLICPSYATKPVVIIPMTLDEYNDGGKNVTLYYSSGTSPFGNYSVVSSEKGITNITFASKEKVALKEIKIMWPQATIKKEKKPLHERVEIYLNKKAPHGMSIPLHVKGTPFELSVWKTLLNVPYGKTLAYKDISVALKKPQAHRAVGTAVGKNTVAYLIPCHRIIPRNGGVGNYRWGSALKEAMLLHEKGQA